MFKKLLIVGIALGAVVVLSLGAIGFAYAQESTPSDATPVPQWGGRGGMMNEGWKGHGGMMGWKKDSSGPMREFMIAALAEGLDMTAEELQTRLDQGETPYQVAQSLGLSDEQLDALFSEAHENALQAAVEAGVLTQEQADEMRERQAQKWQNGAAPGAGGCMGGGHRRGGRQNQP